MKYSELEDVMFKHLCFVTVTSQQVSYAEWLYVNDLLVPMVCFICCYWYEHHESHDHFWESVGKVLCSFSESRVDTEFFFWIKSHAQDLLLNIEEFGEFAFASNGAFSLKLQHKTLNMQISIAIWFFQAHMV